MKTEIKTNSRGMTKLLVTFSIDSRHGLADLSQRTGQSQQELIRTAVAQLLEANSEPESPKPARKPRKPRDIATEDMQETYEKPAKKTRTRKAVVN